MRTFKPVEFLILKREHSDNDLFERICGWQFFLWQGKYYIRMKGTSICSEGIITLKLQEVLNLDSDKASYFNLGDEWQHKDPTNWENYIHERLPDDYNAAKDIIDYLKRYYTLKDKREYNEETNND
jgi:hypothetical protein